MTTQPIIMTEDDILQNRELWNVSWTNLVDKICHFTKTECINAVPVSEGSTHKVCEIQMKDGHVFIVRFLSPFYEAWTAPERTMESEIATMKYVKKHTSIPVPEVYYHDKDKDKSVGYEWMLMEKVPGINLAYIWRTLDDLTRESIVASISDVWAQLFRTRLEKVGSIYSADGSEEFLVGPITFPPFPAGPPPKEDLCGPFSTPREWLTAIAERRMRFKADRPLGPGEKARVQAILSIIRESSIPYLDAQPSHSLDAPLTSVNIIHHPDLNMYNIMVNESDPSIITGIIDWEGSSVLPLWSVRISFRIPIYFNPEVSQKDLQEQKKAILKRLNQLIDEKIGGWTELVRGCREVRALHTRATFSASDTEIVQDALKSDLTMDELC